MKTKLRLLLFATLKLAAMLAVLGVLPPPAADAQPTQDFGDAPSPYPTLVNNNGARHSFTTGVFLGARVDLEFDGQPNGTATGDDNVPAGGDDEDGVTFSTPLIAGQTATIQVVANVSGFLNAWIDFTGDGDWADAGEQIFVNRTLVAGGNTLSVAVPASARSGLTFARFRFTSQSFTGGVVGSATSGEVEDYQVSIDSFDFGDAPDPSFPTRLASNGARHRIVQGLFLGQRVDAELDGQPNANATGDDNVPAAAGPDEDGVVFVTPLTPGTAATIRVVASTSGRLDAWIDFNRNGSWESTTEQIATGFPLVTGTNTLNVPVPCSAVPGSTFARFRFSTAGGLAPTGAATDGEVEDHQVTIAPQRPPQIICPNDITVRATTAAGAVVTFAPTASHPCDTNLSVSCDLPSGSTFPIGTNMVTCTAVGQYGTAACSFKIVVTPPLCCEGKSWERPDVNGLGARQGHAMAGDTGRGRVVLFGGRTMGGGDGLRGDTWEWTGANWISMATFGPGSREHARMAYDQSRGVTVLFGGSGGNGSLADTWEWDGSAWQQSNAAGPVARHSHAMAYDPVRRRVVMYGGIGGATGILSDTWEFDGAAWVFVPPGVITPGLRAGHAMAWDGHDVVLFGGSDGVGHLGDTWKWDGMQWGFLTASGPSERSYPAMSYDEDCSRVVLFGGGISVADLYADTWEWDGGKWTQKADTGPSARILHGMGYHKPSGQTVLYGGYVAAAGQGGGATGDTWLWSADHTPPQVRSVDVDCGENKVTITFDERLNPDSATTIANYQLFCGPVAMQITQIVLTPDGMTVCIFTDRNFVAGEGCVLLISGGEDLCGNRLGQFTSEFSCFPRSCYRTCKGKDFWLTFPGNYAPDPSNPIKLSFCIQGAPGTKGRVEVPGLAFVRNFTIPASMSVTVDVTNDADLHDANDLIEDKGIHITAGADVGVVGFNQVRYTSDAYLGLPSDTLGRDYIVMGYKNVHTGAPDLNGTQFAIVACESNTTVTITLPVDTGDRLSGVPYTITLNQGQTYQLRNTNDAPNDLSGTIIQSDKPVAVFGSHQCANVPNDDTWFCDYIVEQLLPDARAGFSFVTMPLATRTGGDTFRFLAVNDNTTVSVNGAAVATLDRAEFHEQIVSGAAHITSDKPILVTQFANSADFDPPAGSFSDGDPFMVNIPHVLQFVTNAMICAPTNGFPDNYINVVIPSGATGSFRLDGAVPPAAWMAIGASGFSGAQISISTGPHVVSASAAFSVIVYGWSEYESYGYPGCLFLGDTTPPEVTCLGENITVTLQAGTTVNCFALVPDLRSQVQVTDNCPGRVGQNQFGITQNPPAGTPVGPGIHVIKICATDAAGNVGCCELTLTVLDPSPVVIFCPTNIVRSCTSSTGAVVNFQVSARTTCDTNVPVVCLPTSGTSFPIGTTIVNCQATSPAGRTVACTFPVIVNCVGTVSIVLNQGGTSVTVNWTGTGALMTSREVTGPWTRLSNTSSNSFTMTMDGPRRFFRLME